MRKKSNYPKGFYPNNPPWKPIPPVKTQRKMKELGSVRISNYDSAIIPEGTIDVYVEADYSEYNGYDIALTFRGLEEEIETPDYEKKYQKYLRDLQKYNKDLAEWKKWKKIWDEDQENKTKLQRKAMYEKLKKEFES